MNHSMMNKTLLAIGLFFSVSLIAQPLRAAHEPVKIIQTNEISFPLSMLRTHMQGMAHVAINVDNQGVLRDILVLGYTKKAFADAAVEGLKACTFEPAKVDGQPVGTVSEVKIDFTATGIVVSQSITDTIEKIYANAFGAFSLDYRLCTMRDIDRIPVPISVIRPAYPQELAKKNILGRVTVAFFIDESGTIRMPAVLTSDNPILSELAIEALRQWKFEPPTCHAVPVLVRAVQSFNFVPGQKVEIKATP